MSSQRQTTQRPGPRIHRLPRRLDYALVPAPLDLSLDTMTEKSPLPAIIVTPSSPTHSKDFAIAFLAPPPRPSLPARLCTAVAARASSTGLAVASSPIWLSLSTPFGMLRGRRAGYAPIALPISAPATRTEFDEGELGGLGKRRRRSARVVMVVSVLFVLVFCHMLAHFFAHATGGVEMSSFGGAGLARVDVGVDVDVPKMVGVVGGQGNERAGSAVDFLNKLEMQKWLGWMSRKEAVPKA
ncbi:hypothetical protein DFP72DRAFT_229317 [Ephemerocybe angulata]|uniref:Uncharacterized protein n=1 Tax=Ephemerocybe angulata TaxID=980116 RepID=A0A8H6H7B7_9AGAR|nr:hypothetical protein DFP72DRAFT_229317 [Tulosesus angulatus]